MGPIESLIALLAALYLSDCWFLVAHSAVVFRAPWLRGWTAREGGVRIATPAGTWVLLQALPPLGRHGVVEPWPVALTPEFAVARANPRELGAAVRTLAPLPLASAATARSEGRRVLVGTRAVARASSPAVARRTAALLRRLGDVPRSEREAWIASLLHATFDTAAVERRLAEVLEASRPLLFACNVLFAFLIAWLPATLWALGIASTWPALLAGLVVLQLWVLLRFRRAHATLFPEAVLERRLHLFQLSISPPLAVRATDAAVRDALAAFHPLAVARVLLPAAEFAERCTRALREARFGASRLPFSDETRAARAWFDAREWDELAALARAAGLDPDAAIAAPAREDGSTGFCPVCRTQYARADGACRDCDDVPLAAWRE